jgi:ABC-type sugar transport system substrate-binding protein
MKRPGYLLLAFLLAACVEGVLAGCPARSSSSSPLAIAYSFPSRQLPWSISYRRAFEAELKKWPRVEVTWLDADADAATVSAALEGRIAAKVDLILSSSHDHMPLRAIYRKALDVGIPVILTGDQPDHQVDECMTVFSGLGGRDAGAMAAELLDRALGGRGAVAVITGPRGSTAERQDTEGFTSALLARSSGIRVVASEDGRWNPTVAYQKTLDVLSRYPQLDAIYVTEDAMGSAVIRALRRSGRRPGEVRVVSQGGSKTAIADLTEGWYLGIVSQDPARCARQDAWLARVLLEEKHTLPMAVLVRQEMITKDNADRFEGW